MHDAFPPVAELLPHCGRAVMLDAVLEHSANHTVARVCIVRAHPLFVAGHGVPAWAGIEFMAQAAAAHAGLNSRRSGGAPRIGMLLGTRRYQAHTDYFAENMQLEVRAEREFGDSQGVGACRCRISHNGQTLASATLIVVETSEAFAP
ncbi:MAG TPA: 3-hydroxylacyl-ACP dehydratase [Gammaproteobacteria bacterium]|nr:3-hydroxylacyl-ACP dehydratase [Gammaproteobacteria bacterium]